MKMNKKGFTLVELLAVIVILAVVMMLAITAIGPLMAKARKNALAVEGISLVDAAKMAYQAEQLNPNSAITATSTVCFDVQWLAKNNYYSKGADADDTYKGSVIVKYNADTFDYAFWITNGAYTFHNAPAEGYDIENNTQLTDAKTAVSTVCGTETREVNCYGTNACTKVSS